MSSHTSALTIPLINQYKVKFYLLLFLALLFISGNSVSATLENGQPFNTSLNANTYAAIKFVVPEYATKMTIQLTNGSGDLDLYLKYQRAVRGQTVAELDADKDFMSDGATADERIVVTLSSNPPLQAGSWYITTLNYNNTKTNFTITASYELSNAMVVTLEDKDVRADWSAMAPADSYTLYYAYANLYGEVDMNTLGIIEMGQDTSIYAPQLPSGTTFFTAVVAHTNHGDVLSNIVKFMPYGGTVSYPSFGQQLMILADAQESGTIILNGTRNNDGSTQSIIEITHDRRQHSGVLSIANDKPASYEESAYSINFKVNSDGSVEHQVIAKTRTEKDYPSDIYSSIRDRRFYIDCNRFKTVDSWLKELHNDAAPYDMDDDDTFFKDEMRVLTILNNEFGPLMKTLFHVKGYLTYDALSSYEYERFKMRNPDKDHEYYLTHAYSEHRKYEAIDKMIKLILLTIPTGDEITKEITKIYTEKYNNSCPNNIRYMEATNVALANIKYHCPVPVGASYYEITTDTSIKQFYNRDGWTNDPSNGLVGPYQSFVKGNSGFYQNRKKCYSPNGYSLRTNWQIRYNETKQITEANNYLEGDSNGHQYSFLDTGILWVDDLKDHNKTTRRIYYYSNGRIKSDCIIGSPCIYYAEDGSRK